MKAEQVLTASYDLTEEPIETDNIPGLNEAIEATRDDHEQRFVRCDDRVGDFGVYWNEKTDSIRIGMLMLMASYEVGGGDDE